MIDLNDARLPKRFWNKVRANAATGCWEWSGARIGDGYGSIRVTGRSVLTHRFAYETLVASIPPGLQLDHLCRIRSCCFPGHLEPVTPQINCLRGQGPSADHARQTHCVRGHELAPNPQRAGWRSCPTCKKMRRVDEKLKRQSNPKPPKWVSLIATETLSLLSDDWQSTSSMFARTANVTKATFSQRLVSLRNKHRVESRPLERCEFEWRLIP